MGKAITISFTSLAGRMMRYTVIMYEIAIVLLITLTITVIIILIMTIIILIILCHSSSGKKHGKT